MDSGCWVSGFWGLYPEDVVLYMICGAIGFMDFNGGITIKYTEHLPVHVGRQVSQTFIVLLALVILGTADQKLSVLLSNI